MFVCRGNHISFLSGHSLTKCWSVFFINDHCHLLWLVKVQYIRGAPEEFNWTQSKQQVQVVVPGDLAWSWLCVQLPARQQEVPRTARLRGKVRGQHQEVQHGPLHFLAAQEEKDPVAEQAGRQVHGKFTVSPSVLWEHQVRSSRASSDVLMSQRFSIQNLPRQAKLQPQVAVLHGRGRGADQPGERSSS